jgi:CDP-6-deoxy-D-xylo-4-hexulose-3-dehydrase
MKIPLMKNAFLEESDTRKALSEFVLSSPRLSMDTKCNEFENKFARMQGRNFAVLFNSGGSANLALLQALKNLGRLDDGNEVGFSALTWSTNTMPIIQLGMKPVPIDCDISTLNVMSQNLRSRLEQTKLRAFFATNVLGFAGDMDQIQKLCIENDILLIEDNCESLGTELYNNKTGNFGIASTFSFFVAHHMSTIEGGMVCTDDNELAQMLKIVRANGWDRNLTDVEKSFLRNKFNIESDFDANYSFYDLGYNFRPTEITGFIGLTQLPHLSKTINARVKNFERLEKASILNSDFRRLDHKHIDKLSSFAFPVVCNTSKIREGYLEKFQKAGVEIRPIIAGNMQRQPFYKKYVDKIYDLPGADFLHSCGFYFGNYPELTDSDIEILQECLSS